MFTLEKKPGNVATVIESGFSLYKATWLKGLSLSFLAMIFFLLPLYLPHIFQLKIFQSQPFHSDPIFLVLLGGFWLLSFLFMSSLVFRLYCLAHGLESSNLQSLQHSINRLVPSVLVGALYMICVLSGTVLLIVPGFILCISMMFCFYLAINENKGVFLALITSHRLVWGHWWHSFFAITVPILIMLTLNGIFFLIFAQIFKSIHLTLPIFYAIYFASHVLLQSILFPLILTIGLTLLHDLRTRQNLSTHPYLSNLK